VGSALGLSTAKLLALANWEESPLFDETERLALAYADAMTCTDRDVDAALFDRLRTAFSDDELIELTATIAWETASSTFNRALRVPSQHLWQQGNAAGDDESEGARSSAIE
jgi:alkylhydroperoxidase family enzyme